MSLCRPRAGSRTAWERPRCWEAAQGIREVGIDHGRVPVPGRRVPHELLCSSIELFSREVLRSSGSEQAGVSQQAERRARISEKAMARKPMVEVSRERTVIRAAGHHLRTAPE